MASVDIDLLRGLLAAFTGADIHGEKFAITNRSLQDLGDYAATYLKDQPADIQGLIERAKRVRQRALTEPGIGVSAVIDGQQMKVLRETDALTFLKECFEGLPELGPDVG